MLYLVGSRFFGNHRPDSDWDFIGEDSEENRKFCEGMGLSRLTNTSLVRYHGYAIDVCLVNDIDARLFARDQIALLDWRKMTKQERHNKIMELVDAYKLGRITQPV